MGITINKHAALMIFGSEKENLIYTLDKNVMLCEYLEK